MLASVHEQMALVKAQSTGGFSMNYFRQEMVKLQILTAAIIKNELPRNSTTGMIKVSSGVNRSVCKFGITPITGIPGAKLPLLRYQFTQACSAGRAADHQINFDKAEGAQVAAAAAAIVGEQKLASLVSHRSR
jgi:hypothetical protein